MMFSKKEEIRTPFTIEECKSCNKESKRKFKEGDFIFKETSQCALCQGKLRISKIFGEIIKE
ncbi:MAG: hypothetical protein ACE5RN_05025 [Nitrosopumilaceae archaeon]